MSNIAKIVAIFYALSATMLGIAAFLVNLIVGFSVLGVLFLIPTIVLYIEASKGGGN